MQENEIYCGALTLNNWPGYGSSAQAMLIRLTAEGLEYRIRANFREDDGDVWCYAEGKADPIAGTAGRFFAVNRPYYYESVPSEIERANFGFRIEESEGQIKLLASWIESPETFVLEGVLHKHEPGAAEPWSPMARMAPEPTLEAETSGTPKKRKAKIKKLKKVPAKKPAKATAKSKTTKSRMLTRPPSKTAKSKKLKRTPPKAAKSKKPKLASNKAVKAKPKPARRKSLW